MSFVLHCDVAEAMSPCSTSSTLRPRPAASRAMPGAVDAGADDEQIELRRDEMASAGMTGETSPQF